MKARIATILKATAILGVGLALAGTASAGKGFKDPREMKFPPLGEIKAPQAERHVLDNGMVVYLMEDHEFPLVDFRAMVRVGSMYEPEALRGLADITGTVLRTGGTADLPGDEFDVHLESMGAFIETNIGDTDGSVGASFLSENADEGLRLMANLIQNPAFPDGKIDLAKVDARTGIASRNDEPIPIAMREFRKLMYGEHSPYGWHTEYETIEAITRDDLVAFHQRFFRPDQMIFAASGDIDPGQLLAQIKEAFGNWPRGTAPLPPDPPIPDQGPQGVYYAEKDGVTQSTVLFGLRGTVASDPDYAALQLINQILGSGFSSRLVNEIRTRRGLAYAVGSGPGTGLHHPGTWVCYLLVQGDSTLVATEAMRTEVERIVTEPISEEEIRAAKDILLNDLVFELSSKRSVLRRKMRYEFYGYPQDFLESYQRRIRDLDADDLLAAAQRHIHPADMATFVVGFQDDFDGPLSDLGEVTEVDITIPEPPSTLRIPEPTMDALEAGRAVVDEAYQAHGGPAMERVETVKESGKGQMSAMGQQMNFSLETLQDLPDRSYAKIVIGGMFTIERIGVGDGGWTKTPQGVMDRSAEEIDEARLERLRTALLFLPGRDDYTWQSLGQQDFEGVLCDVVHVPNAGVQEWLCYFDASTHRLHAMTFRSRGQAGPVTVTELPRNYKTVDGVAIPFALEVRHDGEPFLTLESENVEINVPVDEALFRKP